MKRVSVALAAVLLAACGGAGPSEPKTLYGQRVPPSCDDDNKDKGAENRCAAWLLDQLVMSAFGSYDDPELSRYVSGVGARLARIADREGRIQSWTFRILDDPDVRAHAQLAGYVYISRGALAVLSSEAELAGLLAHEIAHVVAGHSEVIWERLDEPAEVADAVRRFTRDRDDERQADELAVKYLVAAGYDPSAMVDMLGAIHRADDFERSVRPASDDVEPTPKWKRTHPPLSVRQARAALAARSRTGARHRQRYLERIDGLVLGKDPRNGQRMGTHYVHRRGQLVIPLGGDWTVTMVGHEFRASRDGTKLALIPLSPLYAGSLRESLEDSRRERVAGFAAEVGWYDDEDDDDIRRVAIIDTRAGAIALAIKGASHTGVGTTFRSVVALARPPRGDELAIAPSRIALVRVSRAGPVERLATELCVDRAITIVLEGGVPQARRERGDRIKCTSGGSL